MTTFVADAADARLADAVGWLARTAAAEDELVILGGTHEHHDPDDANGHLTVTTVDEAPLWLPGADQGVSGAPTARLLELAATSGFDVRVYGPRPDAEARPLPASADELAAALRDETCDLGSEALRTLFELARDAAGRIVAFDTAGFVAIALAAGASAGGRARPIVVPAGYGPTRRVRVSGVPDAIEARLASIDGVDSVELRHGGLAATESVDEPIGLLVLPPSADYVDVHDVAAVLGHARAIARPLDPAGGPGAGLALDELRATAGLPTLRGVVGDLEVWTASPDGLGPMPESELAETRTGRGGRALARKAARETPDTKHFLSGRHIDAFVERHGPRLTGRILDFGCGNKPHAQDLTNATTLVGLDIEQSSECCVDVLVEPGEPLPFARGWFDGALCTEVIEHVEEPWTVLEEIGRVVRPGGVIIVSAPFVWPLHEEPRDFMRFSPHALAYLLERAGFEVEVVERAGGFSSVINQLHAQRLHGGDDVGRARIRELNDDGVRGDLEDEIGTISTHFPVLARRR